MCEEELVKRVEASNAADILRFDEFLIRVSHQLVDLGTLTSNQHSFALKCYEMLRYYG